MAAQALGVSDRGEDFVSVSHSPLHDDTRLRYRVDVVAPSVADVVRSAGGWLYDRVMVGWDVNALLPQGRNTRPLQILGVRASDLESEFASAREGLAGHGLAVSAEMFATDARVRMKVLKALDCGLTELMLWGEGWPAKVDRQVGAVQHRLSAAARAFKVQALAAAEIPHNCGDFTETFLCDMKRVRQGSEMIPLGSEGFEGVTATRRSAYQKQSGWVGASV